MAFLRCGSPRETLLRIIEGETLSSRGASSWDVALLSQFLLNVPRGRFRRFHTSKCFGARCSGAQ